MVLMKFLQIQLLLNTLENLWDLFSEHLDKKVFTLLEILFFMIM